MKTRRIMPHVQYFDEPAKRVYNNLETFVLKKFKPKHREEAMNLWANIKDTYGTDYNIDLTRTTKNRLMCRLFPHYSTETNAGGRVCCFSFTSKRFTRPIVFMRNLSSAIDNYFSDLRRMAAREKDTETFIDKMLK